MRFRVTQPRSWGSPWGLEALKVLLLVTLVTVGLLDVTLRWQVRGGCSQSACRMWPKGVAAFGPPFAEHIAATATQGHPLPPVEAAVLRRRGGAALVAAAGPPASALLLLQLCSAVAQSSRALSSIV